MGKRLTQIATRTGDDGTTGLGNNTRVSKNSLRPHAMGDVDELNSHIGLLLCEDLPADVRELLIDIQHQLFNLGGEISIPGFELLKDGALKGPLVKFLSGPEQDRLKELAGLNDGDALFLVADADRAKACTILGVLRLDLGRARGFLDEKAWRFLWVTRFPLFEWSEEEKRWTAMHHPFTSPVLEELDLMETDPARALARAYDCVLNGNEVGGGSIRIHDPQVQARAFQCLGIAPEEAKRR